MTFPKKKNLRRVCRRFLFCELIPFFGQGFDERGQSLGADGSFFGTAADKILELIHFQGGIGRFGRIYAGFGAGKDQYGLNLGKFLAGRFFFR